jgi:DNA-binding CsgD family transcriptional regulator
LDAIQKKNSQSLTARQLQVIDLVAQGFSNKEIANELRISEGTVKQHIFAIFRLLKVSSRAKLVIANKRFNAASKQNPGKSLASSKQKFAYSWRLIVAVVVAIPDTLPLDPIEVINRMSHLDRLRLVIEEMAFALDASSMLLPDGGLLVWFGHPTSHIDDVDRAALLVQAIRSHLELDRTQKLNIGLGISTHAEIVPSDTTRLTSARAFGDALSLAKQSSQLSLSLANTLTERLCSASIPWLELRPAVSAGNRHADKVIKSSESIYAIAHRQSAPQKSSQWGDLSFLKEVFESVNAGVAQWICVESWPPSLANSLVDGIGLRASQDGFTSLKLYIPSVKRKDLVLNSLLAQLEMASTQYDLSSNKSDSTLDKFLSSLWKIATNAPVVLQVFGIQSLQALKSVLTDRGIDRLVGLRVLVVVTNLQDVQKPQTSIRILGPRPDNVVFTRIHTMIEPQLNLVPEGVMVDIQAMVDDLSPAARELIFAAAQSPGQAFNELFPQLNLPRPVVQGALQELASLGLILPRDDHFFDFRDTLTASAISQLNKSAIAQ